jgi:DNA-binding XRE family transcriptional regulator
MGHRKGKFLMTTKEYREIRKKLKLSQMTLADVVGVTNKTISNRERGTKPITKEAEMAIRFLLANPYLRDGE